MAIPMRDCATLPTKDWRWIMERLIKSIQYHVTEAHYFKGKPYSDGYKEAKMAGKARAKGVSQSSFSGIPDLVNSGKMFKGLEFREAHTTGGTIGWLGGDAAKVEWNADMGRAITTDSKPLIPPCDKEMMIDIDEKYKERCKDSSSTTNINLKM